MTAALEVRDLTVCYGSTTVVDAASMTVDTGEIAAVVGPNGAGKSTLIRAIVGVQRAEGGSVDVAGGHLGYAPQAGGLYPNLNALTNLTYFAQLSGLDRSRASAERAADRVGMAPHLKTKVAELSGGQQQRIRIAGALLGDPAVIVLDEPTAGTDAAAAEQIIEVLRRARDAGTAVVITNHVAAELEALDATIWGMRDGTLQRLGTPNEMAALHRDGIVHLEFVDPLPDGADVLGPAGVTAADHSSHEPDKGLLWLLEQARDVGVVVGSSSVTRPGFSAAMRSFMNDTTRTEPQ
jgi:ABC-2 type transport system ATP-binding protein